MQNNNGVGHPACASCKHQRKKCHLNCPLAPYFPLEKTENFKAVHTVFGVSNITKMLKKANTDEERSRVIESLIWEAEWRQQESIGGCWGEYKRMEHELNILKRHVEFIHRRDNAAQSSLRQWRGNNSIVNRVHNSNQIQINGNFLLLDTNNQSNGNFMLDTTNQSTGNFMLDTTAPQFPPSHPSLDQQYYVSDQFNQMSSSS
ncbi:LOB domain-containing protein 2 [Tasmannia lanceolata]|uniref:LOB domain-containing protein 2 n=1 Tax=Tasmannia lanceolata TaxID=3420 RepID=UPI0040634CAF